jgi:hypothetical protein
VSGTPSLPHMNHHAGYAGDGVRSDPASEVGRAGQSGKSGVLRMKDGSDSERPLGAAYSIRKFGLLLGFWTKLLIL